MPAEIIPAGAVFLRYREFGHPYTSGYDTFGLCPTSSTVETDELGPWVRSWCRLDTWRRLCDPTDSIWKGQAACLFELRARRWSACSPELMLWHELHFDERSSEPVFRPLD